uniref:Uncharacterized protein n=1 Tax=Rhizophora mucronata TaxID=61149 RepID=A0A2P2N1R5_RHIMU
MYHSQFFYQELKSRFSHGLSEDICSSELG